MKIIINNNGIIQSKLITKVLFIISKIDLYEKYFSKSPISIQYFNLIWKHSVSPNTMVFKELLVKKLF